jgi:hypothetical protein
MQDNAMQDNKEGNQYMFTPAQFLGPPAVFPPEKKGKLAIAVQFVIPGFRLSKNDKESIELIAGKSVTEFFAIDSIQTENSVTKQQATLFTIAFYGNPQEDTFSQSLFIVERFLSLLSFSAGLKLSAIHIQPTIMHDGHYRVILRTVDRTSVPKLKIEFPNNLNAINPNNQIFSAMSWLRRGLAEHDPVDTFSAFMVCIQIIAIQIVNKHSSEITCPECGAKLGNTQQSITSQVKELLVSKLGASNQLYKRMWKARNAVIAHGNVPITPDVIIELTNLKFEAANLAYKAIKLSLGMPLDSPPSPNQSLFITDAFMYID